MTLYPLKFEPIFKAAHLVRAAFAGLFRQKICRPACDWKK
jgi:hypothetical protein